VRDVSHLAGDLTKRIHALDKAIERDSKGILSAIAAVGKEEHEQVMAGDSGGDRVLSRVGRRGAKIGAAYRLERSGDGWKATLRATGAVPLIANPIKPHAIPKQRTRGRRRVVVIPGIGVRASAQHPGTRGKNTWERGRERAQPRMTRIAQQRTDKTVKQAFLSGG
jgi:hypothetical protein